MKRFLFSGFVLGAAAVLAANWSYDRYSAFAAQHACYQTYPNIPGRILFENDKVVVQRFTFPIGQWEGVHAHPANQLYIHLTDAVWKVRFGDTVETSRSAAGSVGWYGPVHISEDHESVNAGDAPIELVWVTLKDGCN